MEHQAYCWCVPEKCTLPIFRELPRAQVHNKNRASNEGYFCGDDTFLIFRTFLHLISSSQRIFIQTKISTKLISHTKMSKDFLPC